MLFHEIYSAYYNAVARIIAQLLTQGASKKELCNIVSEYAFGESALTILPALESGKWQLLCDDMTTPIKHIPTMPLSELERRWLKAIALDPRIKLFDLECCGLDNVAPLFTPEDIRVYDKYSDGDPYNDEGYIKRFKVILNAMKKKLPLQIDMTDRRGDKLRVKCIPTRMEYSEKDDKFRIMTSGCRYIGSINLARIKSCTVCQDILSDTVSAFKPITTEVTLEITDSRNALERAMLHFAHFEKITEYIGNNKYRLTVRYVKSDESELVIRVLSFGPLIKAVAPASFVNLIKERLIRQMKCMAKGE